MSRGSEEGGERYIGIGAIKLGAFFNPAFDDCNLGGRQGIVLLRHSIVFVFGNEELEQMTFRRIAWSDGWLLAFAWFHQGRESVQQVTTFGFLGIMTGDAFLLEDWGDIFDETYGFAWVLLYRV
jgi:hypothetical protein